MLNNGSPTSLVSGCDNMANNGAYDIIEIDKFFGPISVIVIEKFMCLPQGHVERSTVKETVHNCYI